MTTPPRPPTSVPAPPVNPNVEGIRTYQPVRYSDPSNWYQRAFNAVPQGARQVNVPRGLPSIFGNRSIVFNAWMISMIIVGFDEWKNLHILPRPQRLWDTSLFYGLLTLFSVADMLVPIANAFAIGYTLTLLWQYYSGDITPQTTPPSGPPAGQNTGNSQSGPGVRSSQSVLTPQPTPTSSGG